LRINPMRSYILVLALMAALLLTACNLQPKEGCAALSGQSNIDDCYYQQAISNANLSVCDNIQLDPLKESCISEVAVALNDLSLCETLNETTQGTCIAKIALERGNETLCFTINSTYWWDICFYDLGVLKQDPEICDEMDLLSDRRDECFVTVSNLKHDESVCRMVGNSAKQYRCYITQAVEKGEPSICDKIDDKIWREGNCIKKVAEEADNSSICQIITIDKIKQDCLDKFN